MTNLVQDGIVLVIDMIKDFLDPGEEFVIDEGRDMYGDLRTLLDFARRNGIPIVHTASQGMTNSQLDRFWKPIRDGVSLIPGTQGVEVVDALRPAQFSAAEVYVPKWKYSSFLGTKLDIILNNPPFKGRNSIIITGMATNFCCLCTTIDAFNRDYQVYFVDDLNCTFDGVDGTPAETMHRITVETIRQGYATEVLTAKKLMNDLTQALAPSALAGVA